jgi:hypothetical protein
MEAKTTVLLFQLAPLALGLCTLLRAYTALIFFGFDPAAYLCLSRYHILNMPSCSDIEKHMIYASFDHVFMYSKAK